MNHAHNDDPFMKLRQMLAEVHFELQDEIHHMGMNPFDESEEIARLQAQLEEFTDLAKDMEELLFPTVGSDTSIQCHCGHTKYAHKDFCRVRTCKCIQFATKEMLQERRIKCSWCLRERPGIKIRQIFDVDDSWILSQCKDREECETYMEENDNE